MLSDADSHFLPKEARDAMQGAHRHLRPRIIADDARATMRFLGRNHPRVAHSIPVELTCSTERRLQDVDRLGIDWQLLFPNRSGVYNEIADAGEARELVRSRNDGMTDAERRSGGRLISSFCLTMQHPDEAISELERRVGVNKLCCAVI